MNKRALTKSFEVRQSVNIDTESEEEEEPNQSTHEATQSCSSTIGNPAASSASPNNDAATSEISNIDPDSPTSALPPTTPKVSAIIATSTPARSRKQLFTLDISIGEDSHESPSPDKHYDHHPTNTLPMTPGTEENRIADLSANMDDSNMAPSNQEVQEQDAMDSCDSDSNHSLCYSCHERSAVWHHHISYNSDDSDGDKDYLPAASHESSDDDETMGLFNSLLNESNFHFGFDEEVEPDLDTDHGHEGDHHGQGQGQTWSRTNSKNARDKGRAYLGHKLVNGKQTRVMKAAKARKPRCTKTSCAKLAKMCQSFTDEELADIHKQYYTLDHKQKYEFIRWSVLEIPIKRRGKILDDNETYKKNKTLKYQFKQGGIMKPICKQQFLATLAISESVVDGALSKANQQGIPQGAAPRGRAASDEYRERFSYMEQWIDAIPKTESHYCRKDSKKIYFESHVKSVAKLYRLYSEKSNEREVKPISETKFRTYLKKNKYSLFKPKKDQCNLCVAYKLKQELPKKYNRHMENKLAGRKAKSFDKEQTNDRTVVYTVDTQAQLYLPLLNSNAYYYKTKLTVHNFTTYNLKNREVCNYLWPEHEGGVDGSVYSTHYTRVIRKTMVSNKDAKLIIIWSDGCNGQNRNKTLAGTLLALSAEYQIQIIQKYLEVGHTQMECDSAHSCIERQVRAQTLVYNLETYVSLMQTARRRLPYYDVEQFVFTDFKNYEDVNTVKTIRPAKESSADHPTVYDIKQLRYDGIEICYRLDHEGVWKHLPEDYTIPQEQPGALYESQIPISYEKFHHLQDMKLQIPSVNWPFYDNLPHNLKEKKDAKGKTKGRK